MEFLDLSDLDENEQLRIKALLQHDYLSVQLPWLRHKRNVTDVKNVEEQKGNNQFNSTSHEYVDPTVWVPPVTAPIVNNVYFTQVEEFYPPPEECYDGHHQPNSIYYANTLSPETSACPQFYVIPHTVVVSNVVQNYPNNLAYPYSYPPTAYPHGVTTEPFQMYNNVNINNNGSTSQGYVPSQPLPRSPVLVENYVEYNNNSISNHDTNEETQKIAFNMAVNKESIENGTLCPKHSRWSQIVDTDYYRMGEYLLKYNVDSRATRLQPRGLINRSNYCYIHSILQALVACTPLYNLFSELSKKNSSNEIRNPTPVVDGMCRFVKEFDHQPDIPFEPSCIYNILNGVMADFIEGRQEDAEEFLSCLLNGLNNEMLELMTSARNDFYNEPQQNTNNSESENDLDNEWQKIDSKTKENVTRRTDLHKTPISDIFGGFLKSRIHRVGDGIAENIQPFLTLQLEINNVKTVTEALEAFVAKHQLEGLTSSKTNEEVEAWQQVMLDQLPVTLVLHLKCFNFKLGRCAKIIKALKFPIDLKINTKLLSSRTHTQNERQYKLFAVVYHQGKKATNGHYVTDAFHVSSNSWLRYNDASVRPVQVEHVLKPEGTRVPYLLFYRRSDTIKRR